MNLTYVYASLCIYTIYREVNLCISTVHTHTVDLTRLQVFCLFCRTSVARFVLFPTGKYKEQIKACGFTAGTFACELQIPGFVREITISVKWSWSLVMSTFAQVILMDMFLTSEFGDSVVPGRGGFVTCCVSLPVQHSLVLLGSRNGLSLHFLFAVSCCRTRLVCPVTNLSCSSPVFIKQLQSPASSSYSKAGQKS